MCQQIGLSCLASINQDEFVLVFFCPYIEIGRPIILTIVGLIKIQEDWLIVFRLIGIHKSCHLDANAVVRQGIEPKGPVGIPAQGMVLSRIKTLFGCLLGPHHGSHVGRPITVGTPRFARMI
jgi:hypothetical protein